MATTCIGRWKRLGPSVYVHPDYGKIRHRPDGEWEMFQVEFPDPVGWEGANLARFLAAAEKLLSDRRKFIEKRRAQEEKRYRWAMERKRTHRPQWVAHSAVSRALKKGTLCRSACEICGMDRGVVAHHDDYAKPLDVRWLCSKHHAEWHTANGEAANSRSPECPNDQPTTTS